MATIGGFKGPPKLDPEPLLAAIRDEAARRGFTLRRGGAKGASLFVDQSQWKLYDRARKSGEITHAAADKLCIELLHEHPVMVYGEAYYADLLDVAS